MSLWGSVLSFSARAALGVVFWSVFAEWVLSSTSEVTDNRRDLLRFRVSQMDCCELKICHQNCLRIFYNRPWVEGERLW